MTSRSSRTDRAPRDRRSAPTERRLERRRTAPWLAAAATVGLLGLAGCGGGDDPKPSAAATGDAAAAKTPQRGGTLRVALLGTPQDQLDAAKPAGDNMTQVRATLVYDRMATLDQDQRPQPILYTKAEHDPKGSVWTFTLDPRATFADGSPVTGRDVLASLKALAATDAAANLKMIDVERSRAAGRRVTFVLSRPVADLEHRFAASFFIVLPRGKGASTPDGLNGSGPYRVTAFRAGQRSVLERRKDYWGGEEKGMADRIELVAVTDPAARMRALRSGQVDLADDVSFIDARAARGGDDVVLHEAPAPFVYELILNGDRKPFDDVRVRQALRLAVDRPTLAKAATAGFGRAGNDLWGDGLPDFAHSIPQREQDLDEARRLLREAGKPKPSATIYAAEMAPGLVTGTRLLAEQAKAAGFDLQVRELPLDQYYAQIQKWSTWPAVAFSMGLSFPTMADFLHTDGAPFNLGWHEDGWDDRFHAAIATFDPAERQKRMEQVQRALWERGTDLVWGLAPKQIATTPKVAGLDRIGDYNYPDLTNVSVR